MIDTVPEAADLHREQLVSTEEGRSRRPARPSRYQRRRARRRTRFADEDDEELAEAVDTDEDDLFDADPVSDRRKRRRFGSRDDSPQPGSSPRRTALGGKQHARPPKAYAWLQVQINSSLSLEDGMPKCIHSAPASSAYILKFVNYILWTALPDLSH